MSVMISRQYLEELTIRLSTITRFMESQGNGNGYRAEMMSIARDMVMRAGQLRDAMAARKSTNQPLSLDALRETLSGMSLCGIIADYDKALTEVQNALGDQVDAYERATETADISGRDALDLMESDHLQLHNVMRSIASAEAIA